MTKRKAITRAELIRVLKTGPKTGREIIEALGKGRSGEIDFDKVRELAKTLGDEGVIIWGRRNYSSIATYVPPRYKAGHRRFKALMPNSKPRYIRCYDYGPETVDRYTVVYTGKQGGSYIGMSANPTHPQGVGQHGDGLIDRRVSGDKYLRPPTIGCKNHLGTRIDFDDLTDACKHLVLREYANVWDLDLEDVVLAYGSSLCSHCNQRQKITNVFNLCQQCEDYLCDPKTKEPEIKKHPTRPYPLNYCEGCGTSPCHKYDD